ncbi:hormogonium polysaccharide biosynthesis protein HpsA [Trichocoleus desertorum AS-A10]|uniref:hormogonium polysaccharide biosynthesis protein HpsA n=1 Tax=Trichocoleus desertorum TaxID=1481672 RepID=UPI003299E079
MSTRKQPKTKRLMNWLLRSLIVVGQQPRGASQGFVLPTVVMVTLVVVLLTTAMVLRSFDRSKNASNFRVNETVLNATSPALDRAKAKLDGLFDDPGLPRGTPSETEMYNAIATKERYTFGDETRLKVAFDIDGSGGINNTTGPLQNQEVATTAWRFPVDTDNNGKFDSYTLYGVYLRSPSVGVNGDFNRPRNPLEARSAPMVDDRVLDAACRNAFGGANSTSTFLSSTGWYRVNDVLKKSFFVYAATVPLNSTDPIVTSNAARYEAYKGNKGFSALELQQDRSRIPIYNAAVLYEDDLEITPGPAFRLNGRVFTNSNLLTGQDDEAIRYYQVSGTNSCYIKNEENSKIVVGGNVAYGNFVGGATSGSVRVDLYQGGSTIADANIGNDRKSITNASTAGSYNSQIYTERIDLLVRSAILKGGAQTIASTFPNQRAESGDPAEVKNNIGSRLNSDASLDPDAVRQEEMERYFRQRTRRVPYSEAAFGSSIIGTTVNGVAITDTNTDGVADANTGIFPAAGLLRPADAWAMPTGADGVTSAGYTGLTLKGTGNNMELPMTEPNKRKNDYNRQERLLGDRVFVGNNLPFLRYLTGSDSFVGQRTPHELTGKTWDDGPGTRYRETRIEELPDLGVTNRSGFWEKAATEQPVNALDNVGGLRVITGAGIYRVPGFISATAALNTPSWFDHPSLGTPNPLRTGRLASGAPAPLVTRDTSVLAGTVGATDRYRVVWPDSMPMRGGVDAAGIQIDDKPDLRMRATAVYHYKNSTGIDQTPIACISSYYDPTNPTTAKNIATWNDAVGGKSNNGVVYATPYTAPATRLTTAAANIAELKAQATLVFPDGRIVNEQLQNALKKLTSSGTLVASNKPLSPAENGAIDTAICAIKILDSTISPTTTPAANFTIPHGVIKEVTFLDARQVKAVDGAPSLAISTASSSTTTRTYNFPSPGIPAGTLNKGDVITIGGFTNNLVTTGFDESELNVTRGTITAVTGTSITVLGGTTAAIPNTSGVSAKILETLTGKYNLSLEERQPLEVRATAIDLGQLKAQAVAGSSPNEYLFPNSGIIYASRDDALLDLSAPLLSSSEQDKISQRRTSPVDYRLDSSRRPSAILLENGASLGREANYRPEEKGLVLATDLPVYIKGNFNLHTQEEFTTAMTANWGNFYARTGVNENFACRAGQYTGCGTGDPWRPATVLADAITPLSTSYTFGFRSEGDYDLNNNQSSKESIAKRLRNGFWNNNFVTSRDFQDADFSVSTGTGANSSYFNNFVTPIQRRVTSPTYVMEICRKLPVSTCGPNDWVVGFDMDGNGSLNDSVTISGTTYVERAISSRDLGQAIKAVLATADSDNNGIVTNAEADWSTGFNTGGNTKSIIDRLGAGTTAKPAMVADDQRYARRVSFARDRYKALVFTSIQEAAGPPPVINSAAKPLGVGCPLDVTANNPIRNGCQYPNSGTASEYTHYGKRTANALWFRTTTSIVGEPGENTNITYENDQPLYYLPPDQGGSKLLLPYLPDVAPLNLLNQGTPSASDYAICTDQNSGKASTQYQTNFPIGTVDTTCEGMLANGGAIDETLDALLANGTTPRDYDYNAATNRSLIPNTFGGYDYTFNANDTNNDGLTVVDFSGSTTFENGSTITLNAAGKPNQIFVLRIGASLNIGNPTNKCGETGGGATALNTDAKCNGVVLNLVGDISPNNIVWVSGGSVNLNNVNSDTSPYRATRIGGNFMGKAGGVTIGANVNVDGGRFLGFANLDKTPAATGSNPATVTAVSDDGQPLLAPVAHLQVPTGTPTGTTARVTDIGPKLNLPDVTIGEVRSTKWLAKAPGATTFNLVAAAGDTPARPTEDNGGLHNFLRFLETWHDTEVKAFGSFVQFKRSVFATAPFQPLFPANAGPGGLFAYPQVYKIGNGGGRLPYYEPPNRNWGFDVALLKQRRPDLLAERFSTEPIFAANEFFREASRDDKWVQQLLCAKTVSGGNNAINNSERPANCPTGTW